MGHFTNLVSSPAVETLDDGEAATIAYALDQSATALIDERKGRYRTNVWDYPGVNSFGGRADLEMHPTVKPVALIADAIRDCSNLGAVVLDPFGGSGSTLIAAERTGRKARLIEIDAPYADTIVRRWRDLTGGEAVDVATGQTFAQYEADSDANGLSPEAT